MKIGFLLQATTALSGNGNGVRMQARYQASALEALGHDVLRLGPWESQAGVGLDVVQFFMGGPGFFGIENDRRNAGRLLVFAPIIDSNESFRRYRFAASLGNLWPNRLFTTPGLFQKQASQSDLIICRSRHEQQRVVQGLGIPASKTAIVLNGVDAPIGADPERIRAKLSLPKEFLLHVSAYGQHRKNVARLIEAATLLKLPLVIAGTAEPGPVLDQVRSLAERNSDIRILGYQSREDLVDLFAACRVFCLPSTHEGTGLSALEAAACGAAVVITRHGGPPDYFADMASYTNPDSVESIKIAIETEWNRPKDGRLMRHVTDNLSWRSSAEALVRAYTQALNTL